MKIVILFDGFKEILFPGIKHIQEEKLSKLKMGKFSKKTSEEFYGEHIGKPFFPNL